MNLIVVDNIQNGEVIPYQIFLLRGHIKDTETAENVYISQNNNPEEVCTIKNNTFRAIFHLDNGDNIFTIRFNDCFKRHTVRFERPIGHLPYEVQPVYIICKGHDGCFQAPADVDNSIESAATRILTCAKLIQCVLGELFHVSAYGRKTFYLAETVEIFHSELSWTKAIEMNETELWEYFGREIMSSEIGKPTKKYLAFVSHSNYRPEKYIKENITNYKDLIKITDGYVALGGGGLALFGSASLFTWPTEFNQIITSFADDTPIDRTLFLDHSVEESTRGTNFSATLGAVIHELLHSFELAHNSVGIMGTDFYKMKQLFLGTYDEKPSINSPLTSLRVIKKTHVKDVTQISISNISLAESSLVILAFNKWFNCSKCTDRPYTLSFVASSNFVKSSLGIRAIELRTVKDSYVLKSWIFPGKVLKFSHLIYFDAVINENEIVVLFIIDNKGNFLSENVYVKNIF